MLFKLFQKHFVKTDLVGFQQNSSRSVAKLFRKVKNLLSQEKPVCGTYSKDLEISHSEMWRAQLKNDKTSMQHVPLKQI